MYWTELKGLTVYGFSHDAGAIVFKTSIGERRFYADGDCCSSSWIDAVNDCNAFPGKVLEASEDDGPQYDDGPYPNFKVPQEYPDSVRTYFYKLRTDKGYFDLTMYNNSNGYYGGSLWCDEDRSATVDVAPERLALGKD